MRDEALFERRCGEYVISDDPGRFDAGAMHDFLEQDAYWARERSREQTAVGAANSVVLGAYGPDGSMVGGARIVTDRATFGYVTDVYVLAEHRGRGLGRALAAATCEHPAVAGIKRLMLITDDAHELYRPLGFTELPRPEGWMELRPVPGGPTGGTGAVGGAVGAGDGPSADGGEDAHIVALEPSAGPRPYAVWQGGGLPDPRTAPVSQVAAYLLEVVTVEGPVTADRAYRLYIRGSGSSKVTQRARAPMEQALGRLTLRGQVEIDELDNAGESQQVLRLTGTPAVVVRELGERSLYEVPLNEIAELMAYKRRGADGPRRERRPARPRGGRRDQAGRAAQGQPRAAHAGRPRLLRADPHDPGRGPVPDGCAGVAGRTAALAGLSPFLVRVCWV